MDSKPTQDVKTGRITKGAGRKGRKTRTVLAMEEAQKLADSSILDCVKLHRAILTKDEQLLSGFGLSPDDFKANHVLQAANFLMSLSQKGNQRLERVSGDVLQGDDATPTATNKNGKIEYPPVMATFQTSAKLPKRGE